MSENEQRMWDIWDRHQMNAVIDMDLAKIELCIYKKKKLKKTIRTCRL